MSRAALTLSLALCSLLAVCTAAVAQSTDPHMDLTLLPTGCEACHEGHGASRSPMLPAAQRAVCLACHDSQAGVDEQVRLGRLKSGARPPLLGATLQLPYQHPISATAFSRLEEDAVTCSSCHSPHRGIVRQLRQGASGTPRASTRDAKQFEYELCESCHGSAGPATRSPLDKSRLFDPSSRSSHPVRAPAGDGSPSATSALRGRQISCTDCHGSSLRNGPRGVHGSRQLGLLVANYDLTDGSDDPEKSYALCFTCHDRQALFESSPFPLHRSHVVDQQASCATCHSAHGSIQNRGLVRFGEEVRVSGVSASISSGRLAFESEVQGIGSCYLTCHGVDHGPKSYGAGSSVTDALRAPILGSPTPVFPADVARRSHPPIERPEVGREGPPPP